MTERNQVKATIRLYENICVELFTYIQNVDLESGYKETFRVFSKDNDGCVPAAEIRFVLQNLVGKISSTEIEEMIK